MPHLNCHISYLTPPIEVFLSILESTCHKPCIAYGLTLVPSSLHGWEVFPMRRTLTHTRIIWALSPTTLQISSVTPGSPLCHDVLGTLHREVHDIFSSFTLKIQPFSHFHSQDMHYFHLHIQDPPSFHLHIKYRTLFPPLYLRSVASSNFTLKIWSFLHPHTLQKKNTKNSKLYSGHECGV